ncbi:hypothetical protein ACE38W_00995 [Chitinophaga sp. Hz27]|uniref:SMODS domain-containing nucleotidyltransferase n=1 Tax=Chitinophaga sp. Hz27 TaxID=3347169 RepID=UPI0035D607F1
MSVSIWFETFNNNLRMSDETVKTIAYRYRRMTKQLNKDFWTTDSEIAHSWYVGSYGRDTDIHVSDIDMIFQLPYSVYEKYNAYTNNGQSALLQVVKASVETTYPSSLKADGQVIVVNFTDGIRFEIVPAFLNTSGTFTYPDSNNGGSWKVTNPKPEISEIRDKNILWNNNLKRLARMARAWKDNWNVPMGGLLIDTLAYNFMGNWGHRDRSFLYYDYMSRDFFKFLAEQSEQQYWLSPGGRQYVWRTGNFSYKAKQCYNIALEAIDKETKFPTTAKVKWRDIYGTKFPS